MKKPFRPACRLLGWLFLLQAAGELLGIAVFFLSFDLFGGGEEFYAYGLLMLPLWALWGYFTPRAAHPKGIWAAGVLLLWTALVGGASLLWSDYVMLFSLPQFCAGGGLAQCLPIHYGSAAYWRALPMLQAAAHGILSALFALGLFWGRNRSSREGGGAR